MEHEETRRPSLIGYDERTETWYVRSADSQRLMLTRQSLARLVEMYNSVYTGRPIVLVEERELRKLHEARHHAENARVLASGAAGRRPTTAFARALARLAAVFRPNRQSRR